MAKDPMGTEASRTTSSTRGLRKKGMSKSRAAAIANDARCLQEGRQELLEWWQ